MRRIRQLTVLTLALIGAAGAQAFAIQQACTETCLLSELLVPGTTITAGDKVFDQFTVFQFLHGDADRTFNAANVVVTPLNDGGLDPGPGLSFSVLGDELAVAGDGVYNFLDLGFGFHVTAAPGFAIKDNSLNLTGGTLVFSGGEGGPLDMGMRIQEWVSDALVLNPANLNFISTEFSNLLGTETTNLSASSTFTPKSDYWVTKDILVWASDAAESANLTGFNQRFSQQSVPEPGTLALLALAMVAGVGVSRRRATA